MKSLRKLAELGVGLTAIAVLFIAGCGGGGESASSSGSLLTVTPVLGQFSKDSKVQVKDKYGNVVGTGYVNASGVAENIRVPASAARPLLIEAGFNNDTYYDEKSDSLVTISSVPGTAAIHALVPYATASQVGVTALTEIAIGSLVDASGVPLTGITAASAVGANTAAGLAFGVANPLTPPKAVSGVGATNTVSMLVSTREDDSYALKLAALSYMAGVGERAHHVAARLREALRGLTPVSSITVTITAMKAALASVSGANPTEVNAVNATLTPPSANVTLKDLGEVAAHDAEQATAGESEDQILISAKTAASGVVAAINGGMSAASAVEAAAAATPIAAAKTLLTSLRTNANLLHNTSLTGGFIDQQVSGVKADFNGLHGTFDGFGEMQRAMKHGVELLQPDVSGNYAAAGTSVMVRGAYPCGVTVMATSTAGTAVCQWFTSSQTGDWATHQLTIMKTTATTYGWSESLIGVGNWNNIAQQPPMSPLFGMTLLNTTPTLGTAITYPVTSGGPGSTTQTGTATVVGTFASGTVTSLSFSGNIQPGYAPTTTHDHTAIALNGTETTGTNNTFAVSGSMAEVNSSGASPVSFAISSGSNLVDVNATGAPVSVHLVEQAKTPNYQFDGTVDMSAFAQDAATLCVGGTFVGGFDINCASRVSDPHWYPGTASFTGSVTGIGTNAAVGKFMTGTLSMTSARTTYDSRQQKSSTNFPVESGSFVGSIINGSATYRVNLTAATGSTGTTYNTTNTTLTYTDPSNNTVTVTGAGSSSTATMGGITIAFSGGSSGSGNVYSGTPATVTAGTATLIGTISGSIVNFIDGTTVSVQ